MTQLRSALVWSVPQGDAKRIMDLSDADFLKALHQVFGYRLGRFTKVGKRVVFPLRQVTMTQQAAWPVVFIGNAANTLHPVAGQGFNLGLRDGVFLAQCILQQGINSSMLDFYQQSRRVDQLAITRFADGLVSLFAAKFPGIGLMRGAGLLALDNLEPLKNILTHYTQGFAGLTPDLACGIPMQRGKHERDL